MHVQSQLIFGRMRFLARTGRPGYRLDMFDRHEPRAHRLFSSTICQIQGIALADQFGRAQRDRNLNIQNCRRHWQWWRWWVSGWR